MDTMKRHRTLVSILVGLVLLLQGWAVAAAPRAHLPQAASLDAMADMPCHARSSDQKPGVDGTVKPSCCNADCPDMTTCALGHFVSVVTFALDTPRAHVPAPVALSARQASAAPAFLLRPPILSLG